MLPVLYGLLLLLPGQRTEASSRAVAVVGGRGGCLSTAAPPPPSSLKPRVVTQPLKLLLPLSSWIPGSRRGRCAAPSQGLKAQTDAAAVFEAAAGRSSLWEQRMLLGGHAQRVAHAEWLTNTGDAEGAAADGVE
jgi:hypothetical protein